MSLLVGLGVVVVIGSLLGWVSFHRLRQLQFRVDQIQRTIMQDRAAAIAPDQVRPEKTTDEIATEKPDTVQTPVAGAGWTEQSQEIDDKPPREQWIERKNPLRAQATQRFVENLRDHWMIWLGGLCVALAGIFLVKYSIDQGLLGPAARIILATITGLILHACAEWLRRRTGASHPSFAALAGGASITLYAAMLAALHLYQLLSPGTVFLLLAVIALATMWLSLVHGPVLAIIGILGAYVVPALVSNDSGNIVGVMIYALIISAAALLLMRFVYRTWLWYGMLVGALGWWWISLFSSDADGIRGYYLALLAYGTLAIPGLNWLLANPRSSVKCSAGDVRLSLVLIIVALGISIAEESYTSNAMLLWSPLVVVLLFGSRARPEIQFTPWLSLFAQWIAWLYCALEHDGLRWQLRQLEQSIQDQFLVFAGGMALLYSGLGWWLGRGRSFSHLTSSLTFLAPVCWLALSYLLVTDLSSIWQWSLVSLALGLIYIILSQHKLQRDAEDNNALWLVLAGHLAYSLAVAMFFREATLTLALATQLISLTWLMRRFQVENLHWLVKALLGVIVVRLTLNPWLLSYPADTHWSFWTYGGTTLCCVLAARLTRPDTRLRPWLEAVAVQLFVLFTAAETRYWLYDGNIFVADYSLEEAAVNTALWSALGLVYFYRARLSQVLRPFYTIVSAVLLVMASINYVVALTALNPVLTGERLSTTPVWNILLPAYGLPVVMAVLTYFFYNQNYRKQAAGIAGIGFLVFISMEIRHLWQGAVYYQLPTPDGELYTYSVVWLAIAVTAILQASRRNQPHLYKGGMGLLLVVIAKLFLIDMSGLEDLWRVASFMGLGLSLLGLAYLHQRITQGRIPE